MTKVLVSDPIDQAGIDILGQVAQVDQRTGLSEEELIGIIGEYDGLMIRSGTQVTADVIEAADPSSSIIGRAGVGVDNVDVPAATQRGVLVVNSPEGNTIAAAEHALALLLSLSRHMCPRPMASMRAGKPGIARNTSATSSTRRRSRCGRPGQDRFPRGQGRQGDGHGCDRLRSFHVSAERAQQMQVKLLTTLEDLFRHRGLHHPAHPSHSRTPKTW